jgi:hypothetical protein
MTETVVGGAMSWPDVPNVRVGATPDLVTLGRLGQATVHCGGCACCGGKGVTKRGRAGTLTQSSSEEQVQPVRHGSLWGAHRVDAARRAALRAGGAERHGAGVGRGRRVRRADQVRDGRGLGGRRGRGHSGTRHECENPLQAAGKVSCATDWGIPNHPPSPAPGPTFTTVLALALPHPWGPPQAVAETWHCRLPYVGEKGSTTEEE